MISALYVDDEPDLLDLCSIFLERDGGIHVDTLPSATEALSRLNSRSYDVIISDYHMPEMDGIEFLKHVRSSGNTVPFILFTGRGREDVVIEALNNGADFYLQKGGDPRSQFAELIHKVRTAVDRKKALDDLRIHAERLDMAQEIGNVGSWEYILATRAIWASEQAFRIFGFDRPSGTVPFEVIEACYVDPDLVRTTFADAFRNGKKHDIVYAINPADGSARKIIHSVARYVTDTTGSLVKLVGVIQDVTEKRRAEEELLERETMLNTAQQVAHIGSWDLDLATQRVLWSDELFRILGLEPRSFTPLLDTVYEFIHPEDREPAKLTIRQAIETHSPFNIDIRVVLRDGSIRILHDQGEVRYSESGAPLRVIGTALDITRQKQIENALRESQEKHRLLLDESSDPIFSFKKDGTYEYVNRAFAGGVGKPLEAIVGHRISEVFPADEAGKRFSVLSEVFTTGNPKVFEVRVPRSDGDRFYLTTVTPIKDLSGNVTSVICSSKEITDLKKAGEELRASEEKFRSFVENANDLVYTMDPEGRFTYISPNIRDLLGYSADEINGNIFGRYFHPDDLPVCRQFLKEIVATGEKKGGLEYRLLHRDGSWRWFLSNNSVLRNSRGEPASVLGIARDVTDQKQIEQALRKSEERFRNLVNNLRDVIWQTTPELRFTYVSPYAEAVLGYPPEEIVGKTLFDFITPASVAFVRERLALRIATDEPHSRDPQMYVVEMLTKNGRQIWVEVNTVPVYESGGQTLAGFQGISRDITARKLAETALANRVIFQQTLIDSIPYPVFIKDQNGRFVGCNRAYEKEFATTRDYMLGKTVLDLEYLPMDERERFQAEDMEVIRTAGRRSYELSIIYADGQAHQTLYSVDGFRQADGQPGGLIGMLVDISGRKQMEDALKNANRQLYLLTSITRHDINNKISAILGYLDLAEMKEPGHTPGEYIEKLKSLTMAIQTQIEFTKVYQDLGSQDPRWQLLDSLMPRQQVPLGISFDANLGGYEVFADPMLPKVFFNLLDNTIRHGEHVSRVSVSARDSAAGLLIVWEDDGAGIPHNQKERIFDRGFGKNTGLGLFLVREILALSRISIRETGMFSEGARFEILVPKGLYRVRSPPA